MTTSHPFRLVPRVGRTFIYFKTVGVVQPPRRRPLRGVGLQLDGRLVDHTHHGDTQVDAKRIDDDEPPETDERKSDARRQQPWSCNDVRDKRTGFNTSFSFD